MSREPLHNMTPTELASLEEDIDNQMRVLRDRKRILQDAKARRYSEAHDRMRTESGKPFGVITWHDGGCIVKAVKTAVVDWDQTELMAILKEMVENGHDPREWIDVKLAVTATRWNSWDNMTRAEFKHARIERPAKVAYQLKKEGAKS